MPCAKISEFYGFPSSNSRCTEPESQKDVRNIWGDKNMKRIHQHEEQNDEFNRGQKQRERIIGMHINRLEQ